MPDPPTKAKRGRKVHGNRSFKSNDLRDRFIEAAEKFGWVAPSAASIDVHESTVRREFDRDPEFKQRYEIAKSKWISKRLTWHAKLAAGDARANEWELERIDPDAYGKREPESVTPEMLATAITLLTSKIVTIVPAEYHDQIIAAVQGITTEMREKKPAKHPKKSDDEK